MYTLYIIVTLWSLINVNTIKGLRAVPRKRCGALHQYPGPMLVQRTSPSMKRGLARGQINNRVQYTHQHKSIIGGQAPT